MNSGAVSISNIKPNTTQSNFNDNSSIVNNVSVVNTNVNNKVASKNVPPVPGKNGIPIPPPMVLAAPKKKPVQENKNEVKDKQIVSENNGNTRSGNQMSKQPERDNEPQQQSSQPLSFKDVLNSRMCGGKPTTTNTSQPNTDQSNQNNQQNSPLKDNGPPKLTNFLKQPTTALDDEDDDEVGGDLFKVKFYYLHHN